MLLAFSTSEHAYNKVKIDFASDVFPSLNVFSISHPPAESKKQKPRLPTWQMAYTTFKK